MPKSIGRCAAILALAITVAPGQAEQAKSAAPAASEDCEARIQKLEASTAEGEERLAEKNVVIVACSRQYRRDTTIERLVKECAKYEEQPVVKQQLLAECQLAAYGYANALRSLKAEYRR
jgi:uncharacterized coiled-coil protein SlyX